MDVDIDIYLSIWATCPTRTRASLGLRASSVPATRPRPGQTATTGEITYECAEMGSPAGCVLPQVARAASCPRLLGGSPSLFSSAVAQQAGRGQLRSMDPGLARPACTVVFAPLGSRVVPGCASTGHARREKLAICPPCERMQCTHRRPARNSGSLRACLRCQNQVRMQLQRFSCKCHRGILGRSAQRGGAPRHVRRSLVRAARVLSRCNVRPTPKRHRCDTGRARSAHRGPAEAPPQVQDAG
ncbi:hypothetical protein C2E23DRAFT_61416 [Lenzites betulinus]|nr:hypothetical protein C2E23DRAFT_61416 [Lenzites betulinus]